MATTNTKNDREQTTDGIVTGIIERLTNFTLPSSGEIRCEFDADVLYTLLGNSRRREIMRVVSEADGGITIGDLVEMIAAAEQGVDRDDLSSQDRKRVYVSCYQTHLPKLEEHGVVAVEEDGSTVKPAKHFSSLLRPLERVNTADR